MTARDFCYWLQGYFELNPTDRGTPIGGEQAAKIRAHLNMVFAHEIDPSAGDAQVQAKLDALHSQTAEGSGLKQGDYCRDAPDGHYVGGNSIHPADVRFRC